MTEEKDNKNTYRTRTTRVKQSTPITSYFETWCYAATRLYNSAVFLNRNTLTGLVKPTNQRHPNQQYAIEELNQILPKQRKTRWKTQTKKLDELQTKIKNAQQDEDAELAEKLITEAASRRKDMKELANKQSMLNYHHRRANYSELDAYYKYTDHDDYRTLPVHSAQAILKEVTSAFDEWGKGLHDWRCGNSAGRTSKPNMPYYKKNTRKTITIPAADMKIIEKDSKTYAQFPLIKQEELLDITGIFPDDENIKLAEVKIEPISCGYDVVFVFKKKKIKLESTGKYLAGGDLGLDNLLTIVSNDGVSAPLIIDGKELKSINRYWNAQIDELKSILPNKIYTSKKIEAAWLKRAAQLHDGLNQAANIAVEWLVEHDVKSFVLGKNDGWKEEFGRKVPTNRKNKQDFVFMPYEYLIKRLRDKCGEVGIELIVREESYTSKASLVDGDFIPVFGEEHDASEYGVGTYSDVETRRIRHQFSGSRVYRGLYQSKKTLVGGKGVVLNADVNGAGNILRKEFLGAFDGVGDWRFLMCPYRVRLHVVS